MKQTVRKQIKKLADFSYPGLKTINGEDDFVELIKKAKTAEDYDKAALSYLKFIVESPEHKPFIKIYPDMPELSLAYYICQHTNLLTEYSYLSIMRIDELLFGAAKIFFQFSLLWNASTLKEARQYARMILDILLADMKSKYSYRLFRGSSYRRLLTTTIILVFQLLGKEALTIMHRELTNPIPTFAYQTATILWKNDLYAPAALLYKQAIESKCDVHPLADEELLDAYNCWGLCEIEQMHLMRANEIYSDAIAHYGDGNSKNLAYIYSNMAYVLGLMADRSEDKPTKSARYRKQAVDNINKALSFLPEDQNSLYTKATLFYDQGNFAEACKGYKELADPHTDGDRITKFHALRDHLSTSFEINLLNSQNNCYFVSETDMQEYLLNYLERYIWIKSRLTILETTSEAEQEIARAEEIISCYQLVMGLKEPDLGMCLLKIYFCAQRIRGLLQYNIPLEDWNCGTQLPIAYYTTLGNAKYLLKKTPAQIEESAPDAPKEDKSPDAPKEDNWPDAPKQAANRLTMMHVHYMNDPNEGNTLIKALSTHLREGDKKNYLFIGSTYKTFRRKVLDKKYVFLKSFTRLVDQLNMWSAYASDRSSGSDSNGLCICVNPQTFLKMQNPPKEDNRNSNSDSKRANKIQDDYNLYRVAYIQEKKVLDKEGVWKTCAELVVDMPENQLKQLTTFYNALLDLFVELNEILASDKKLQTHESLTKIWDCLSTSLSFISFLFKDASYEQEQELRLVLTRPIRNNPNPSEIRKTPYDPNNPNEPQKLFVMPPHQIFVEKIILGPKVPNPDTWIPQLQHQLAEMWENWPITDEDPPTPKVRKSSISYR